MRHLMLLFLLFMALPFCWGATFQADPTTLNFGEVPQTTTKTLTFTLNNITPATAAFSLRVRGPYSTNPATGAIAAAQSQSIQVTILPDQVSGDLPQAAAGLIQVVVGSVIENNITLHATVVAPLKIDPLSIEYGQVRMGVRSVRALTLTNIGSKTGAIVLSATKPFFLQQNPENISDPLVQNLRITLQPRQQARVGVAFLSTEAGTFSSKVQIVFDFATGQPPGEAAVAVTAIAVR